MVSSSHESDDLTPDQFWQQHLEKIQKMVRWERVPKDYINDIVNQVAIKSKAKWDTRRNRTEEGTLGWIYIIVRHTAKDFFRKQQRDQSRYADFDSDEDLEQLFDNFEATNPEFLPADLFENKDRRQRLWEIVQQLKSYDRLLVFMYYYQEKSVQDIATELNFPYERVKKQLQRIPKKLWQLIREQGLDIEDFTD